MRSHDAVGAGASRGRAARVSSRQAVRRMRHAYTAAEAGGLQVAYADVRWRTRAIRPVLALADRLYPMTEAVHFAGEMDHRVRVDGLADACLAGFERLGLDHEFLMSNETRDVLASSPAIVYGNHPTMLTPFLVGAALRRPDVRFFMMSYVGRLIPGLRQYMLPLESSSPRGWLEWKHGGNRRAVAHWLTQSLEKGRGLVDAKPSNRQVLGSGAQHVLGGGCVVIFPGGGVKKDRAWYPGIGQIARQLANSPDAPNVFLVPMREENSTDGHVYRGLRALRQDGSAPRVRLPRICVRFAEPRRLQSLVDRDASARHIASALQADYEEAFPCTRTSLLDRLLFPWRVSFGRGRA